MSDAAAKYTQCPFCETAFKLSSQQLILAKGLVRCGSCKEVFRADQRLMSSPPMLTERIRSARIKSSPQAPTTPPPPAKTATTATTEPEDNFNIDMGSEVEGTAPSDGDTSYTPIIEQDFAANAPSQHAAQRFQHAPALIVTSAAPVAGAPQSAALFGTPRTPAAPRGQYRPGTGAVTSPVAPESCCGLAG